MYEKQRKEHLILNLLKSYNSTCILRISVFWYLLWDISPSFTPRSSLSVKHCWYYRKFPKYSDTQNICCNHAKIWIMWLYNRIMSPNGADVMANSVDPDQTAPRVCTVRPGLSVRKLRIITVDLVWYRIFMNIKWAASWQNQQNGGCAQRRLRSAWASAQSDQSLRCPHEESLGPYLPIARTAKTLIRLGGWANSHLLVLSWDGANVHIEWFFNI